MADLIEGGRDDRPPSVRRHRGARAAATVAAGVAAVTAVVLLGRSDGGTTPLPEMRPSSSPVAISTPSPEPTTPTRPGACGSSAPVVDVSVDSARTTVPLRLLVGGAGLRSVDATTGAATAVPGVQPGVELTSLAAARGSRWALGGAGCATFVVRSYRVGPSSAAELSVGSAYSTLVAGPHGAWLVVLGDPSSGVRTRAVPLDDAPPLDLPPDTALVADVPAGLVATVGGTADRAPQVVLLDPTGRRVRDLLLGAVLGVSTSGVVLATDGQCGYGLDQQVCTLVTVDTRTGRTTGRYSLPPQRLVASGAVLDASGRLAAFALARTYPDPRYVSGDPVPPADVVVLDLASGELQTVPQLLLPPKTSAGLAIDGGTGWLVLTLSQGDSVRVLAWKPGAAAPTSVAELPGSVTGAPPVLIEPAR